MDTYTVEVTYYLPVYQHVTVEANSPAEAATAAKQWIADNGWEDQEHDYDCSSPEYVTGIWSGDEAHTGVSLDIPAQHQAPNVPW